MNQTEIPRDLPTFAAFVRGAMRREPTDIIVGECRDSETDECRGPGRHLGSHVDDHGSRQQRAANHAACGQPVPHPTTRANLVSAVAQSLRLIVNQRLTRTIEGRRTALREVLVFDAPLRNQLLKTDPNDWPSLTQRAVEEHGISYRSSIERAVREGRISEQTAAFELRQVG